MAIENAKTLNVRIRNKYDSYENWAASSLVLEAGEIAIAYTSVDVEVDNGVAKHPALLMKVGDGTNTFANLPWLSAKAADVAAWAKAANKPAYEAKEITGIDAYIADYVNEQMGISVDTDTQYQIVKVDDYNYKLQSKGKTDEAWADVADSAIVIPNDTAAIEALEDLVGDTKVATQIANAFKNEDGSAKYALASELATEAETARAAEKANADAITKLNANAETEGSVDYKIAQKFATLMENPDEAMNSIQELVDWTTEHASDALEMSNQVTANKNAIEKLNGDAETDGSVAKQVAGALTEAKGYTDTKVQELVDGAVKTNADDIAALEKLVGDTAVATQITDAIDGALMVGEGDAKTEKYALATALAATDAEVAKKANDVDLAAIAKTGSTDDLVQGELVLVFDCGTSAV